MRKALLLTALAAMVALGAAGCATTGDPKAGGLFGWSEAKAQQRRAAAWDALDREEAKGEQLRAEQRQLQGQISAKKRELAALKKNDSSANEATAAEISRLEKEIEDLNKEALVLMDL
ncbi:MAG: hypothetical protein LBV79_07880 [Candidatus Adiutrix sp.]|jgi:type IV pilus biogenesis protein CpaD/CtpE|nr:hypothetical protein [Candidatus Adiutrix sp.]